MRDSAFLCDRRRRPVKDDARNTVVVADDLDVRKSNAGLSESTTEDFHDGFLRRKTSGEVDGRSLHRLAVMTLVARKNTISETRVTRQCRLDSSDVDQVRSDRLDHRHRCPI